MRPILASARASPISPDALSAHSVVLVADDVLDAGTDIAVLAAVGLASGRLKVG